MLSNVPSVADLVRRIREKAQETDIVFLDYNTNEDYTNLKSPLSHAALVKLFIEGRYPETSLDNLRNNQGGVEDTITNQKEDGILPFFDEL